MRPGVSGATLGVCRMPSFVALLSAKGMRRPLWNGIRKSRLCSTSLALHSTITPADSHDFRMPPGFSLAIPLNTRAVPEHRARSPISGVEQPLGGAFHAALVSIEAVELGGVRIRERPFPFVPGACHEYEGAVDAPHEFNLGVPVERFSELANRCR